MNLNLMEKYKEMGYKVTGMVSMTKINYKIILKLFKKTIYD